MATAAVTNQFTASTTIVSDDVDTNFADLVTFLNGSVVHVDGAKAMTGALAMGTNKVTGLAAATTDGDALRWQQFDGHEHSADDTTSDTFATARIPSLNASKITAGILGISRIPADLSLGGSVTVFTAIITTGFTTLASNSFSKPSGWGSALVIVNASVQYAAVHSTFQMTGRIVIDTSTGSAVQSGQPGDQGEAIVSPVHAFETSEATINISLQLRADASTTSTAKYLTYTWIAIRAS